MQFLDMKKVFQGKYLKLYELHYLNRSGKEKSYEMISYNEMTDTDEIGTKTNGISIVAIVDGKLLLLREFRMAARREIYNLCAGMVEDGENIESAVRRELYEETGLSVKRIIDILPPSFAAIGFSDVRTQICFVEAQGEISFHGSANEQIKAGLYTQEEVLKLLETEEFSSRSQFAAYIFAKNQLPC